MTDYRPCTCHATRLEHLDWAMGRFGPGADMGLIDKALDMRLEEMRRVAMTELAAVITEDTPPDQIVRTR